MYSYIKGKLVEKHPTHAIIDIGGMGYMVHISLYTYTQLGDREECMLHLHHVVREDAHLLFGFMEEQERNLFRQLISVSGIGANTARLILSSLSPEELVEAIVHKDVSTLKSVKGIGARSAERIIVDLKDKLEKTDFSEEILHISHNTIKQEALTGLIILGFSKVQAEKAIDKVLQAEKEAAPSSVESLIKEALRVL
jgi:Holliday junction DNA helicase RuvA